MFNKKVQIKLSKNISQPSIAILKFTQEEYKELECWKGINNELYLIDETTNVELNCQISPYGMGATPEEIETEYNMFILVNNMDLNMDEKVYTFLIMSREKEEVVLPDGHAYNPWAKTTGVFLDNQESNARTIVSIGGKLFTRYLYSHELMKPYYYPLIGPQAKSLIQDGPDDHLHHHGLWWGHDGVNGHQLYHEFRGEGRQSHIKFLAHFGGTVIGQITDVIDWCSAKGERLLKETRTMRIYNLPNEARYIDVCSQLHATDGDVQFSNTKEGGFPFIRVNEQLSVLHTGTITSSTGKKGEKELMGQEADWVDYSGKLLDVDYSGIFLNGVELKDKVPVKTNIDVGIAIFLHPDSDDYPTKWFVRNSGAFTSSNFHFGNGYRLTSGNKYTFKQRIYIHTGSCEESNMAKNYEEYKNPLVAIYKLIAK
ncbi:MAG TPA: PmoA family protein [Clostridiaceae bacterium]